MAEPGSFGNDDEQHMVRKVACSGEFQVPLGSIIAYEESIKKQVERLHKHYLRKSQKQAFECSAKCCDAPLASGDEFDHCNEICFARTNDMKEYAETEFDKYNKSFIHCIKDCQKASKKIVKEGGESVIDVESKFQKCTKKCFGDHAFLLHKIMEKIVEAYNTTF